MGLGWQELILIFIAVLLLFGAKRLPEIAQGLGKGIREFKKAMRDTSDELKGSVNEQRPSVPPPHQNHDASRDDKPKEG